MRRFYFLILAIAAGTYHPLQAGVFIYPAPSIPTIKSCQTELAKLSISSNLNYLDKALSVFSRVESMLEATEKESLEFYPLNATMGRRWIFRRGDDERWVKTRFKNFEKRGFIKHEQVYFLEGREDFKKSFEGVKSQIPYLFKQEKYLLLGALVGGGTSLLVPSDVAPLPGVLGLISLVSAVLARLTIPMSISHQLRYDFVEYLVDCANKFEDPKAGPVILSISSGGKTLNAAMIPGDEPQLAVVISSSAI